MNYKKYGNIHPIETWGNELITHPVSSMARFASYTSINENLNFLQKHHLNIKNIKNYRKDGNSITLSIKYSIDPSFFLELAQDINKVSHNTVTRIFYELNEKNNINLYSRQATIYQSSSNEKRYHCIAILSYCIYLLENDHECHNILLDKRNINNVEMSLNEKKIYTILVFYYTFIFTMPFIAGTACIAEISLHTLFKKYMPRDFHLIRNEHIMLDVEALSLPFEQFYLNCIHHNTKKDPKYTPYLIIT